jgi:hypothetical protein
MAGSDEKDIQAELHHEDSFHQRALQREQTWHYLGELATRQAFAKARNRGVGRQRSVFFKLGQSIADATAIHRDKSFHLKDKYGHDAEIGSKKPPEEPETGFRERLGRALDSQKTHLVVMILLAIDVIALVVELAVVRAVECNEHPSHHIETLEEVLHYLSISILIIFTIEIVLLLFSFDRDFFRHPGFVLVRFAFVFARLLFLGKDFIVVPTALGLELAFRDSDFIGFVFEA